MAPHVGWGWVWLGVVFYGIALRQRNGVFSAVDVTWHIEWHVGSRRTWRHDLEKDVHAPSRTLRNEMRGRVHQKL